MSRTARFVALVALLLTIPTLNLIVADDVDVALDTEASALALPCYDMYQGCVGSGKSAEYCDGVWCGCMRAKYGTTNC